MTNDEARKYFENKGLTYDDITEGDILSLTLILNKNIKKACKEGRMSTDSMRLSNKINTKLTTKGSIVTCFIYINSNYFTRRECISFNRDGFIGFGGWADDINSKVIVDSFIEWCDKITGEIK